MSNTGESIQRPQDLPPRRILLIGWEGADWNIIQPLVDAGEMPHLNNMIDRGVMGSIASLIPMVCPILWTSIATGVFADRHDVLTMIEPDGQGGTHPVQSSSRRRKAIWNILSQNKLKSAMIGWPVTYPAEAIEGLVVSDRFLGAPRPADDTLLAEKQSVHPPELHDELIRLRVYPDQISRQQLASFVPGTDEAGNKLGPQDAFIARLLAREASAQQAATWAAQKTAWDFMAVYYGMLGGLNRGFMQYHPPCDDSVDKHNAALYGSVIKTGYKFHDMMLGRLVELVGPETLVMVVSDHGFRRHPQGNPAADPSAPLYDHRRDAFFCTAGPGVRKDELVFGTRLVDVAPTILASLGLPVPEDMDGRVITKIFESPPPPRSIESYEPYADGDGMMHWQLMEDSWVSNEINENLSALGLVHLEPGAATILGACSQQRRLNLAQTLASQGRLADAVDAYRETLLWEDPFSARLPYIECLFKLGRLDEAAEEVTGIAAAIPDSTVTRFLQVRLATERGDMTAAESYLDSIQDIDKVSIGVLSQLGWIALHLHRWKQATRFFEQILEQDHESAQAHEGLGMALLRLDRVEDSVFHHTQSVRFLYHRSTSHEHLGESLVKAGQLEWAERAFKIAIELDPKNERAHKWLKRVVNLRQGPEGGCRA